MDDQVKFLTSVGISAVNLTSAAEDERVNIDEQLVARRVVSHIHF